MEKVIYDALIVGAGMAGLTSAAYLSRAGMKVLVCEKEEKTGGLVNSFEYNGFIFDGGIRSTENSGILLPMLRQLGIEIDFLPSPVSIGIGKDVMRVTSKDCLEDYQKLLEKSFPESSKDISSIIQELRKIMGYMDIQYGIDNPLFMDLTNMEYVSRTILPWVLKYLWTLPKITKLYQPVDEYLHGFSHNQALIDIISQHFFQKTPAYFALSYFSLYLDYRYPRGGTGSLSQALERFIVEHDGEIKKKTEIIRVDIGRNQAVDSLGNVYQYKKLIWAADLQTLFRLIDPAAIKNKRITRNIQARRKSLQGKTGGDSVFTLYLTVNLDKDYFEKISTAHFFYTPSISGLSHASLDDLKKNDPNAPNGFTDDKNVIADWLKRSLDFNTYEISCPSLRDNSLAPVGKTGLIISVLFDYSLTKHIQEMGWYEEFKMLMADHIIALLDASIYPGLKEAVIDSFASTPLTIERISGTLQGAITGWAFTNKFMPAVNKLPSIARSILTPIPDTYQAGQWTYSPAGLPISILTGKLAADRVLKDLG